MRKNTQTVLEAWRVARRGGKPGSAIWTEHGNIYSYATALLTDSEDVLVLNVTRYSVTTTRHQNSIRAFLDERGFEYVTVDNQGRGATPLGLRKAANVPDRPAYPVQFVGLGAF